MSSSNGHTEPENGAKPPQDILDELGEESDEYDDIEVCAFTHFIPRWSQLIRQMFNQDEQDEEEGGYHQDDEAREDDDEEEEEEEEGQGQVLSLPRTTHSTMQF
jgi:hypothetical protein